MQDSFQVVDQKQIIRKAKDRHIFLFEMYLVFCKDVKDTNGKAKYIYKAKFLVSCCTILKLFFHIVWQTVLNLGPAWLVCVAKNINKYSNKPDNRYERIIQRFYEDLATSENC